MAGAGAAVAVVLGLGFGGNAFCVTAGVLNCCVGAVNCTFRRAMSDVVGFGMAADGLNGEMVGAGVLRCTGGNGAPATGISMVVTCGTVTVGMLASGTVIVEEYGTGLFVMPGVVGHWLHAAGVQIKKMMKRLNTLTI